MIKDIYSGNSQNTISLFSELLGWKNEPPLVKNTRPIRYPLRQTIEATKEVKGHRR